jgi:uncharacterized protein (TIGR01244 family)
MNLPASMLNDEIAFAPQLAPEAMPEAAAAGFRSVINNRPDFEGGPDQPTSAAIEAAARAAGLEYAHLPVSGASQTPEQAQRMADLMARLPKPVLAFCRSGTRSGRLYAMARELRGG